MILVQDLVKRYGDVRAVDGVTFSVERGEVVGFLGPNGAGKSTTMRCLAGTLHADAGRVAIGGVDVRPDDLRTRAHVGYLPETTPLYRRMRAGDYLDFVGRLRGLARRERRAAIARVASDCGLDGRLAQRIGELSKGYRQRVGLAQALLADPDVLILDEPTSGLDPAEVARMRALVRALGERKTILLSTHVLPEVQETCRRVVILARGRVVADGTPLDLAASERAEIAVQIEGGGEEVYAALCGLAEAAVVRATGVEPNGRRGFALEAEDRFAVARAVFALCRDRGWTLCELRHERASLEQVFLRRTQAAAPAPAETGA